MMRHVAVIALLLAAAACKKTEKADPGGSVKRVAGNPDAAAAPAGALGPVRGTEANVTLVVYYLPKPTTPPRPVFDELARSTPEIQIEYAEKAPPLKLPADSLAYMSRGLDDAQRAAVPRSEHAVMLGFANRAEHAVADLRRAHAIAGELADRTGGLVWSEEARMIYGKQAWKDRVDAIAAEPPEVAGATTVHMYEVDGGGIRVVSLGLGQLALPELVIDDAPRSRAEASNVLINRVAQGMQEGKVPGADGRFTVENVEVKLVPAVAQDGDNPGRLWRIDFLGEGSYSERLAATTTRLFEIQDDIINAGDDDAELLAARDRARAKLPEVRARFVKGLASTDRLMVKGPLGPPGRVEWVWIEVRRWEGGKIRGVLMSQPMQDIGLKEGSEVEVAQADVFDWMLDHAGGNREGGETDEILLRRQR